MIIIIIIIIVIAPNSQDKQQAERDRKNRLQCARRIAERLLKAKRRRTGADASSLRAAVGEAKKLGAGERVVHEVMKDFFTFPKGETVTLFKEGRNTFVCTEAFEWVLCNKKRFTDPTIDPTKDHPAVFLRRLVKCCCPGYADLCETRWSIQKRLLPMSSYNLDNAFLKAVYLYSKAVGPKAFPMSSRLSAAAGA